jgi:hypothetical protein
VFCIAIQSANRSDLEILQRTLLKDPTFDRTAAADKLILDLKPVGFTGYPKEAVIDENGNLQGKGFHAAPALEQVIKQAQLKGTLSREGNTKQAVRLERWQCPKCSWPHAWFDGALSSPPLMETCTCANCGKTFNAPDIYRMGLGE